MKNKLIELDVDFIGGQGPLTAEEEKAISEFLKTRKLARAKRRNRLTKTASRKKTSENESRRSSKLHQGYK